MYYNKRGGFYVHTDCKNISTNNSCIQKKLLDPSVELAKTKVGVGCCFYCKQWDLKENFSGSGSVGVRRKHKDCGTVHGGNKRKMDPYKATHCAFTGRPFGKYGETRPQGDHDHDTLLYRGHIWAVANRAEGAVGYLLKEMGWTIWQFAEAYEAYMSRPAMDIGLQPYHELGYATREEALEVYNETTN